MPRLIALLRVFAYLIVAAALSIGGYIAARDRLQALAGPAGRTSAKILLLVELGLVLAAVIAPTALMTTAFREPATRFGWGRADRLRQLAIGLASGVGLLTALLVVMALMGGFSFGSLALAPAGMLKYAAVYAAVFTLTAIGEEGLLRGYGFVQLCRAISFWPATILTSLIFLALHMIHQAENPVGLASVGLVGVVLAYSFRRSGALWFAWGYHAAWDFSETFLYGVPDSGLIAPNALMRPVFHGPDWLTGGSAGPEGSLLVLPTLAALAVIARVALAPNRTPSTGA